MLHGSPVGTLHRFRITGITPPAPACRTPPVALCPGVGLPHRGLLRPLCDPRTRVPEAIPPCTYTTRLSVREAVHSCLPRPHGAVLDSQKSPRPSACLCEESTWRVDAVARGPPLTDGHWTSSRRAFAMSRGARRATVAASSAVPGFVGRLLFPCPFGFREAADPRISSESFPSAMGMLHKLLRRTGRWRQSAGRLL